MLVLNSNSTLSVFLRDTATGQLTPRAVQILREGAGGIRGLNNPQELVIGDRVGDIVTIYVGSTGNGATP